METLQRTANRGSISTGFDIDNSLKFERANSEQIFTSNAASGNRKTWTFSAWIKRTELSQDYHTIFSCGYSNIQIMSNDRPRLILYNGSSEVYADPEMLMRDTSTWYHIVVQVDSTQSTASDRVKWYINGDRITNFNNSTYTNMSQNEDFDFGQAGSGSDNYLRLGEFFGGSEGFSGYMSDVYYLNGTAAQASDFGEYDSDSGIWIPKEYTGSGYGTQGFHYKFDNASNLGEDSSGEGHDANNLSNITSADQATDTPTNNFCTWSPLWAESRANGTITEGATQVAWGGGAWKIARSSMAVSKGRWYWEIKGANVTGDTWNNNLFGFASVEGDDGQYGPTVLIGYSTGNYYYRVANSQTSDGSTGWDSGGAWSSSDIFGFALDLESSTKKFILYRNGSAVNGSGTDLVSAFQTEQFFTTYSTSYNGDTQFLNWGGYTVNSISSAASDANGYGTFAYAPPSGYYAICTKNLAEYG